MKSWTVFRSDIVPFNRTSMESKRCIPEIVPIENAPFNRTSMESKHSKFAPRKLTLYTFNRTSMESKPYFPRLHGE